MRKIYLTLILPLFTLAVQPDFKEGVTLYNQGAYWEALQIFSELAEESVELNPQRSAAGYMRVRCYNKLGFHQRALMLARQFPDKYPQSEYLDDIQFLLGEIYLDLGDPREAAWQFANVAVETDNRKVRKESRKYAEAIVATACNEADLKALSTRSLNRVGQFLALLAAERYMKDGQQGEALAILFNLRPFVKDEDLRKRAINLYSSFKPTATDSLHIAVVLPLSGPLASIGQPLLDGIRYAAMSHTDTTGQQIILHIFDNESDLSESIKIARTVSAHPEIVAQIDPLTNENIKGSAAILDGKNIPLIAPAATEDKLSDLSEGLFQFRATRERKAEALAEYAVKTMGLKTFAIIAPSTEYGQQFSDNFSTRVDKLGGMIQYQGWYAGEPADLSSIHFRQIRELGLEELYLNMQKDSLRLDSLLSGLITEGDSINIYEQQLQPILKKQRPSRSDSLRVELSHIDGMFFPIHKGSIPYIASQLAHNNLVTHVLGDENWIDLETLKKNASYLPKLTIVAGDRLGFVTIPISLSEEYFRLFKHQPDQYDFMGIDVMGMVLKSAPFASGSGSQFWEALMTAPTYQGMVHQIQWGGDTRRENALVFLMDYRDLNFELTGYFDNSGFFSMDSTQMDSLEEDLPSDSE